mmetsp:Transcript_3642/g.8072  ORF Transcript_3642/g.8072 Transcript_3642/m.8072 type:complete len:417 (-) Transcript_3642:42-1292(-)
MFQGLLGLQDEYVAGDFQPYLQSQADTPHANERGRGPGSVRQAGQDNPGPPVQRNPKDDLVGSDKGQPDGLGDHASQGGGFDTGIGVVVDVAIVVVVVVRIVVALLVVLVLAPAEVCQRSSVGKSSLSVRAKEHPWRLVLCSAVGRAGIASTKQGGGLVVNVDRSAAVVVVAAPAAGFRGTVWVRICMRWVVVAIASVGRRGCGSSGQGLEYPTGHFALVVQSVIGPDVPCLGGSLAGSSKDQNDGTGRTGTDRQPALNGKGPLWMHLSVSVSVSMAVLDASSQGFVSKFRVVLVQEGATGILGGNPNGRGERRNKGATVGRSWSHNDVPGTVVIGMVRVCVCVRVCLFVGWVRSRWSLPGIGARSTAVIIEVPQDAGSLQKDPLELLKGDPVTGVLSFQSLRGNVFEIGPQGIPP